MEILGWILNTYLRSQIKKRGFPACWKCRISKSNFPQFWFDNPSSVLTVEVMVLPLEFQLHFSVVALCTTSSTFKSRWETMTRPTRWPLACGKPKFSRSNLSNANMGRWIIVPHMAIISSLLLAGNNPFIFQTAVGASTVKHRPVFGVFAQSYESRYKTEWLWFRGRSKYIWLQRVFLLDEAESASRAISEKRVTPASVSSSESTQISTTKPQLTNLKSAINLSIWDWVQMIIITTTLIFVPFLLAFLISFYTPTVGLSCRSMTFLLYFLAQTGQVALWAWVLSTTTISSTGTLHSPAHLSKPGLRTLLSWIAYWALAALFIGTSIFAAIGGTIMQLLGVYNNCLCALPMKDWSIRYSNDPRVFVPLWGQKPADVRAAQKWWMAMGSTATGFLCVATYFGWWYQRRLRGIFRDVAERI